MSIPQYTTPTFTLTFDEQGLNLKEAAGVYVTFRSGANVVTKSGSSLDIGERSISVYLDQSETGKFKCGELEIQANWTGANGERSASEVEKYQITEQLLKRVIT